MNNTVNFSKEKFNTDSKIELALYKWEPKKIDKIVILVHGMAEHSERYNRFASFLADKNIAVFALDLRGHGKSVLTEEYLGFFGKGITFRNIIDDICEFITFVQSKYPDKQTILLGHSMGSFISQGVLQQNKNNLTGCILSGTGMPNLLLAKTGKTLAWIIKKIKGENHKSKFLDNMAFANAQKKIENPQTKFDWLSRDKNEVQKYIDDPLCGFLCSASFFHELTSLNCYIQERKNINSIPKQTPILFIAGTDDPVGNYTVDIDRLIKAYQNAGINNIVKKYYQGGRHEMLNEINYQEVQNDILQWVINFK
ncbi:MAG: hypothetical protein CR988_02640 [Treponema sp.]|nr:MAG: hypothetical protein CR988_02640 [Treponema sp.]